MDNPYRPHLRDRLRRAFERGVAATGIRRILQLDISVRAEDWTGSMRGCGMLVLNPPFGFEPLARSKGLRLRIVPTGAATRLASPFLHGITALPVRIEQD